MKKIIYFLVSVVCLLASEQIVLAQTMQEKSIVVSKPMDDMRISNTIKRSIVATDNTLALPKVDAMVVDKFGKEGKIVKSTLPNKRALQPGQSLIFAVDNNSFSEEKDTLTPAINAAIDRTPKWLHYDLQFKFQMITNTTVRTKMVNLLNSTEKKYLDEVAFTLAFLPIQVLNSSRFASNWEYLKKNVELIYTYADSLQYVRLVENGDTNSGDWHTTTEYRIKQGSSYIWRAVDKYYYYNFVMMPKIEQEGLYVTDNNTSITAQRTWGYAWRDYLWNNFSQAVNTADTADRSYNNVYQKGYKPINSSNTYDTVRVDTIPRFGSIMQMPTYLWNESTTIWLFNRAFTSSQSALNVLGNWASQCVPMDVTSTSDYRPSQPNHIAWKHVGNCHEDALIVVAACRTALIPCIHVGDLCDDHVWAAIHDGGDSVWHHFEFFRGGCSPSRAYYWGMTNLQEDGGYSWNSSLVQGYVPDGTLLNFSGTYSKSLSSGSYVKTVPCTLNLTITDINNVPVDGARVQLYSTNTQYSTTYTMSAGYLWSDAEGKIVAPLGTGKKYYMRIYHPKFGSFPEESDKVYTVISSNAITNRTYSVKYAFPTETPPQRHSITAGTTPYDATKSLKFTLKANNITTGKQALDGQSSTFYDRTNTLSGLSVYVATESQIDKFKNADMTAEAMYGFGTVSQGEYSVPIPSEGKSYIVLTNNLNYTNLVEVEYEAEIVDGAIVSVEEPTGATRPMYFYPNPAQGQIHLQVADTQDGSRIEIYSINGQLLLQQATKQGLNTIDVSALPKAVYVVKCGKEVFKLVKE